MRLAVVGYHGSVHTRRWAAHLAGKGHDLHVVTCGVGAEDGAPLDHAYAVHDLGPPRGGKAGYLAKIASARRVIRQVKPDVVHAHYATSYGMLAMLSGVRPLVVTAHGDDLLVSPRNPAMRRLVSRVLRSAALITVPGEHMERAARKLLRGRAVPVQVLQYGVESARLAGVADAVGHRPGGVVRIVSVRPLLRLYRIDVLLASLAVLAARGVDCTCEVVGRGPALRELEAVAARAGVDSGVTFHGQVAETEVERMIASADVYVSVAETDGASLALLEALALGAVPVVSDIPANRAWVRHDWNGVLVAIDPEALATGIEQALTLDRAEVRQRNRDLVARTADRSTNLDSFERSLHGLVV